MAGWFHHAFFLDISDQLQNKKMKSDCFVFRLSFFSRFSAVKKDQQKKFDKESLIFFFSNNQQTFFKHKSSFEESDISEICLPGKYLGIPNYMFQSSSIIVFSSMYVKCTNADFFEAFSYLKAELLHIRQCRQAQTGSQLGDWQRIKHILSIHQESTWQASLSTWNCLKIAVLETDKVVPHKERLNDQRREIHEESLELKGEVLTNFYLIKNAKLTTEFLRFWWTAGMREQYIILQRPEDINPEKLVNSQKTFRAA